MRGKVIVGLALCAVWLFPVIPGAAQQGARPAAIVADAGRPLAHAISVLEKRHHVVVTYEELPHVFAPDIWDVTSQVRRDGKTEPRVLVPGGPAFSFDYSRISSDADVDLVLDRLLAAFQASGNAGSFRVVRGNDAHHVAPFQWKTVEGDLVATRSLLDTEISITGGTRSALGMLEAIVGAITSARGIKVSVGVVPVNRLKQTQVNDAAVNEPARNILERTLRATGLRVSWRLFCDARPAGPCGLSTHTVGAKGWTVQQP
jgi:hypothetical protein